LIVGSEVTVGSMVEMTVGAVGVVVRRKVGLKEGVSVDFQLGDIKGATEGNLVGSEVDLKLGEYEEITDGDEVIGTAEGFEDVTNVGIDEVETYEVHPVTPDD